MSAKKGKKNNSAKDGFSANPFATLKGMKKDLPVEAMTPEKKEELKKKALRKEVEAKQEADEDRHLFLSAMQDVERLGDRPPVPEKEIPVPETVDEDLEAQLALFQLVHGNAPFDFSATDEYIEGCIEGLDRRILKRLRKGEYSIQDQVDLHGLRLDEARALMEKFIVDSQTKGLRCVLVVHGRGLHSKDRIPVLKESLKSWLMRGKGKLGRAVLAFTSARQVDGGLGAMYVLLRRRSPQTVR